MSPTTDDRFEFEFATNQDDPDIRRLLREIVLPGLFSICMTREPDFFMGAGIEGDTHYSLLARDAKTRKVIALGSRSLLDAFVNGKAQRLGYFGHLRVDPQYRGGPPILSRGFQVFRNQPATHEAPISLMSIVEDNLPAQKALSRCSPLILREQEAIGTFIVPLWRNRFVQNIPGFHFRPGQPSDLLAVSRFLQEQYTSYQFAPVWREEVLSNPARTRSLALHDFILAFQAERLVGCVAVWDQRSYKQTIVVGYHPLLSRFRRGINLLSPMIGWPRFPAPGKPFEFGFLSHFAADGMSSKELHAMLSLACNLARSKGLECVSLGLATRHPHFSFIKRRFKSIVYRSILYTAHWPEHAQAVQDLDNRIAHVEIAML